MAPCRRGPGCGRAGWTFGRGGSGTLLPLCPLLLPHTGYPCAQPQARGAGLVGHCLSLCGLPRPSPTFLSQLRRGLPSRCAGEACVWDAGGLHHAGCPGVAVSGDGAAVQSPELVGHGRVLSWGVTSGSVREPRAEAVPDPLGFAGTGLFASTGPVLLWANNLWNAFLILKEITRLVIIGAEHLGSVCKRRGWAVSLELAVSFVI